MGKALGGTMTVVLLLVGVAAAVFIGISLGYIHPQSSVGNPGGGGSGSGSGCANGYTPPSGFLCVSLPIQALVFNPFIAAGTSNGVSSATVSILDPVSLSGTTPAATASTGATTTTGINFNSGANKLFKVSATGYTTETLSGIVPPIASSASTSATAINVPLPIIQTNTWSWSAAGAGTSWSSTFATYNFGNTGLTTFQMTFTLNPVTNNYGFHNGYDYQNKLANLAVISFKSASTPKTTMTSCQYATTYNNVAYCIFALPDGITTVNPNYQYGQSPITADYATNADGTFSNSLRPQSQTISVAGVNVVGSLTSQLQGTSLYPGGNPQVSFSVTFNQGSLTTGGSEAWTMDLFLNADIFHFIGGNGYGGATGSYGADVGTTQLNTGQATITLKA